MEALYGFLMLSSAIWGLSPIFKHSDTKWVIKKNHSRSNCRGGGACCAPPPPPPAGSATAVLLDYVYGLYYMTLSVVFFLMAFYNDNCVIFIFKLPFSLYFMHDFLVKQVPLCGWTWMKPLCWKKSWIKNQIMSDENHYSLCPVVYVDILINHSCTQIFIYLLFYKYVTCNMLYIIIN